MIDFMIFLIFGGVVGLAIDVNKVIKMLSEQKRERDKLRKDVDALMVNAWKTETEKPT